MYKNISNKMKYFGVEPQIIKFFKNLGIEFIEKEKNSKLGLYKHEVIFNENQFEKNKNLWFEYVESKENEAREGKTSVTINLDFKNLENCYLYNSGRCASKIDLIRLLIALEKQQSYSTIELHNGML